MAGKPYQSKLMPYEDEIIALRRKKPPKAYSQIAELLREKYQLTVSRGTIFSFIKLRVKKEYKPCKYDAWDIKKPEANNQPTTEAKAIENSTALPKQPAVPDKPKQTEEDDDFEIPKFEDVMKYSDNYNLTLLSKEEADALRARIRRKIERDKLKAMQSAS